MRPISRQIIKGVADGYGLTVNDLLGDDLTRHVTLARQHGYAAVRKHTQMSLPAIGRVFGGRHHTTILHGIRAHEARQ